MVQLDEARKQLDARQKTRAREESRLRSALTNLEAQAAADAQQVVSAQQAHEELLQDLPAYLSPVTQTRPRSPPTSLAPNCKVGQPAPAKAVHVPAARALAPTPAACPFPKKTDPPKLVPSHAALTDVVHALVPQHKVSSASAKVAGMMPVSMAPKASLASARQTTRMQQAGRRPACLQQALPPIRHPSTAVEQSAQLAPLPPGAYCMQWLAAASTQAQAQTHPQARAQAQAQAYPQAQAQAQAALFQTIAAAQKVSKPPLNQYMLPPSGQTRYPSAACSSGPAPAVAIAGHALTQKTAAALTGVNKHLLHTGAKTLQQGLRTQQTSLMSQQMAIRAQQATQQPAAWSRRTAPALHAVQPAAAPSTIFLTQSGASAPAASAPPAFPLLGQATTPMHPVPGQQRLSAASPAQASSSEVLTAQPAFSQVEVGPQACTHPSYLQGPTRPSAAAAADLVGSVGHSLGLAMDSGVVESQGRQMLPAPHVVVQTSVAQRVATVPSLQGAAATQSSRAGVCVAQGLGAQRSCCQALVSQIPSKRVRASQHLQASLSSLAALETQGRRQHHTDSTPAACNSPQLQVPAAPGLPAELLALFCQPAACTPQAPLPHLSQKVASDGLLPAQRASSSWQPTGVQNAIRLHLKCLAAEQLTCSLSLPQQQAGMSQTFKMPENLGPSPLLLPPSNVPPTFMSTMSAKPDGCAPGKQQSNAPRLSGLY